MLVLQEVLFSTIGGLRGGLALILVQTVLAAHTSTPDLRVKVHESSSVPGRHVSGTGDDGLGTMHNV